MSEQPKKRCATCENYGPKDPRRFCHHGLNFVVVEPDDTCEHHNTKLERLRSEIMRLKNERDMAFRVWKRKQEEIDAVYSMHEIEL